MLKKLVASCEKRVFWKSTSFLEQTTFHDTKITPLIFFKVLASDFLVAQISGAASRFVTAVSGGSCATTSGTMPLLTSRVNHWGGASLEAWLLDRLKWRGCRSGWLISRAKEKKRAWRIARLPSGESRCCLDAAPPMYSVIRRQVKL